MTAVLTYTAHKGMLMIFYILKADNFSDLIYVSSKQSNASEKVKHHIRQTTTNVKHVYTFIIKRTEGGQQFCNILISPAQNRAATGATAHSRTTKLNSFTTPVATKANSVNYIPTKSATVVTNNSVLLPTINPK